MKKKIKDRDTKMRNKYKQQHLGNYHKHKYHQNIKNKYKQMKRMK